MKTPRFLILLCTCMMCLPAFAQAAVTIKPITAYNFVVDSNVLSPSTYAPQAATIGATFCNDGAVDLTDVSVYTGDYSGTPTPGLYPQRDSSTAGFIAEHAHLSNTGIYSLTHEGGSAGLNDASRYIGTLAAGKCSTQYWLISYPRTNPAGTVSVTGGSIKPDDDLWLEYDFWATAGGVDQGDITNRATMRNEISAAANKIWPNGDNKVPDEYKQAIIEVLGWDTLTPGGGNDAYPGETVTTQGVWYDLGNVGAGFDNNGDLVPDKNIWMQPVGDPTSFDAGCFRLIRTYGLVIVKLKGGGEKLIPFENQLYFEGIPENTGAVGLVFYEYAALDGACTAGISPYQEVASGFDNEKFSGDYGISIPPLQSKQSPVTISKAVDQATLTATGGTLTYTIDFTNTGTVDAGNPTMGTPLVVQEVIPAGTEYVAASTSSSLSASVLYSTDNGISWVSTEPAPASVTNIQWWLDTPLAAGASGTVGFQVDVPNPFTGVLVNNTAGLSYASSAPFTEDDAVTLISGSNTIGDTVFADDGTGGGTTGNGIQDGTEPGTANIKVSLYYDRNGDGTLDSGDVLWGEQDTDGSGNYSFTSLPDGDFIVIVDTIDIDLSAGAGPTTPTEYAVTLSGADFLAADFGFVATLAVTKTLTSASPVYTGDTVTFDIDVINQLTAGPPQSCTYTTWTGSTSANAIWITPTNAQGAPDGSYATVDFGAGGSWKPLIANGWGVGTPAGNITKVEVIYEGAVTGTLGNDIFTARYYFGAANAASYVETTYDGTTGLPSPNGTFSLAWDITIDPNAHVWSFADFAPGAGEIHLEVDSTTQNAGDPADLNFDAIGFRITTDQSCNPDTLVTVPLTDTFDPTKLQFVSATVAPDTTVPGLLTWNNIGPIAAGATQTITVTFTALTPGMTEVTTTNTGTVSNALFFDGTSANDDTDSADVSIRPVGSIGDTIFWDANGNGQQDANEPGVPGVDVTLTLPDLSTITLTTDANGKYLFSDLRPSLAADDYIVTVDLTGPLFGMTLMADPDADGLPCTDPSVFAVCDSSYATTISAGANVTGADFGYQPPGVIGDTLWNDANDNGLRDDGEYGIPFVTVTIVELGLTTETDSDGYYSFSNIPDGNYTVRVDIADPDFPPGLTVSYDNDGSPLDNETPVTITGGSIFLDADFGYRYVGTNNLSGTICLDDPTFNGVCGAGDSGVDTVETALSGTTAYLYLWNDGGVIGVVEPGETTPVASTITDAFGDYSFTNIPDGAFVVAVGAPLEETELTTDVTDTPAIILVKNPAAGENISAYQGTASISGSTSITGVDYAYRLLFNYDFGDLPNVYITKLIGGARHKQAAAALYLGTTLDFDFNGMPTTDATGDDVDATDDEDGLTVVNLTSWTEGTVAGGNGGEVDVDVVGTGYLTGWIDFNGDGFLTGSSEMIVNQSVTTGTYNISFDIPVNGLNQNLFARFRLFPAAPPIPELSYRGSAENGEVEDYLIIVLGTIGDYIWNDLDGDGVQDGGEPGIDGVTVDLYRDVNGDGIIDAGDALVSTTTTAGGGLYDFTGLTAGDYIVDVTDTGSVLTGYGLTGGADPAAVSGLTTAQDYNNADFGYQQQNATIGDYIWNDADGDGVQDGGESGIDGVTVDLYRDVNGDGLLDGGDVLITTVTSAGGGLYDFTGLAAGNYIVDVTDTGSVLTGYVLTGGTDPVAVTGLTAGQDYNDADFGYLLSAPALTIVKSITSGSPYTAIGQTVNYSYVITNSGNVALAGPVAVSDDKSSDESCPAVTTVGNNDANLDPGESITCTASYTILAADVTAGSVTNIASATVDGVTSPTDTATAYYAALSIVKSITSGNPYTTTGNTVNYSYVVTNTGSAALAGPVVVSDDKSTDEACPNVNTVGNNDTNLDPGESITCTASYTIQAADVTAGSVTNTASATVDGVTSPTDTATATLAGLSIVKSITSGSPYTAAGNTVNYSYVVTNTGSAPLAGPVVVSDDKSTDEACPNVNTVGNNDANLDPGENITCTASYTILAADVTAGSVTNTASATVDGVTSPTDTATAYLAGLSIVKSITSGNPFTSAGNTVNYSYVVTNTGSAPLAGPVIVADDKSTDEACPNVNTVGNNDTNLDPGESITCTASYTILAADVIAGSVTNIASATIDGVTSLTDTATAYNAALSIVKSITSGSPFTSAGDTVNYSYLVTNTGSTALAGPVVVSDDKSTDEACPAVTTVGNNDTNLDPGESITCTASYTILAADVTAGSVTNTASATVDGVSSPTDTATATLAGLSIVKSIASGSPYTAAGDTINYSYVVTNTGSAPLAGPVAVSDDKSSDESCPAVTTVGNNDANLDPAESITCTASYTILAADVTAGSVTNIASATVDGVTSPTDTATATLAGLSIVKSIASGSPYTAAGNTVNYSYVVTNTGSAVLAGPVTVADDKSTDEACPNVNTVGNNDANLDPGESITCTASYTILAADVTAGSVTNIASATVDGVTSPTDTATAYYAALSIVKSITSGNPYTVAGDTVNYSYVVTNTGSTALAGPVAVADDKSNDEACPNVNTVGNNDANLDPGESITCTASYTILAADVTAGSVTNIASATVDGVTSPTDTATATLAGLSIVKSITSGSPYTAAGNTVNYSYVVTNTGSIALAGPVVVSDDKSTDEACPNVNTVGNNDANLDPGESITCTASYTILAADVTAGSVTNIASATVDGVTSPTDTATAYLAGLSIAKSITSGSPYTAAGDTVNYSYVVTNTGSTALAGPVVVSDDKSTDEACPAVTTVGNNDTNLDPAESITCTASYTILAADVTAGSVTNIASATVDGVTSPTDTATAYHAALSIVKSITSGNPYTVAGNTVNYSYVVTNTGSTPLAGPVTVADDKSTDEACPAVTTVGNNDANLDPGESITCTASYTILAADVTAGSVTNIASATVDGVTSPTDTATAYLAGLSIVKSITSGSPYTAAGNTVNYSYVVTNTGSAALAGPVVVSDDKSTDEACPNVNTVGNNDANLDPGESIICTASYTILAADVIAGSVTNTASATVDGVTSPTDTATAYYAALSIVKSITSGNPYTTTGNTVNYSYVVTNTGSAALAGPVVVSDDKSTDEACPNVNTVGNNDANLDPGENITCTASYTILAADVTAGSVTNIASATIDGVTSPTDTATAYYAALSIVKSITSGNPYTVAGNTVNYSYVVTNTGSTALAGPVTVADDKSTDEACPAVTTVGNNDTNLDPGENITCTASYTILAADITAGSVTNTASATVDGVTSPTDTATATLAGLSIIKSITSGSPYTAAGNTVNYSYVVTNTGSAPLAGPIAVSDDKSSDESCPAVTTVGNNDANLDPAESITCTASYTILAADVTAGSVTNIASATVDGVTSPTDTATATLAGLSIVKSITSGSPYTAAGDTVNYSYVVTNTGSAPLAGPVTVADDKSTDEACPAVTTVGNNDTNLDPGESITCTASYTILAADVTAGSVTNIASATVDGVTSPTDTATATLGGLSIVKSIASGSPYTTTGNTVNYSYVVTNTGNTPLAGPVTVADDKSTDESCPNVNTVGNNDANLDPGESITCTASYTILAADVTAGSVTNIASATVDGVTSPTDTATAYYEALSIVKSITSGSPFTSAGDTVNYSYLVTNTGSTALAGPVTVADDKSTDEACPAVTTVGNNDTNLDPGESITCTASYTILAADVTAGSVTNIASATVDGVTSPTDTATATLAGLSIVKSITSGSPYTAAGDTVNYSYVVTNTGSAPLAGPVVVSDDKSTDEACPAVTTVGNNDTNLDPGESITCTASYTILAADVTAGSVTNIASATVDGVTSPTDTATAYLAGLSIVKSITSGNPYTAAGDTVNYSYVVTNTGSAPLAGPVTVADDKSTDEACPAVTTVGNNDTNLDPGESITCTASYTILAADVTAGSVTNIASATVDGVTSPTDTATAYLAGLSIVKSITSGNPFTSAGNTVNYSYVVTNTGSAPLAGPVIVADDKSTDEACPNVNTVGNNDANLDPGESITCTASYTILAADVTAGSVTNIASAMVDVVTSPTDTATATLAGLSIVKSIASGSPYTAAGNTVNYSYVVTNTGSTALTGPVTVADDKSTDEACPAVTTVGNNDTNLDPGESITCTASYTILAADVTAGSVTNIASAMVDGVTSPTDTATATLAGLSIVKSIASGSPYTAAGNTVNYSYVVTNTGSTALAGPVVVSDDKSTDEACPAVTTVGNNDANLDPGESITCTASYTILAADVIAGSVTNTASATVDGVTSPTDTATAYYAALSIVKSITSGNPYTTTGNTVNYSYVVINTGSVPLAGPVTVADDKSTDEACPSVTTVGNNDANLDPGESITCTASYTILQADVDNGSVTNIASATADSVTSPTDTATANATQSPSMTLTKTQTSGEDPVKNPGLLGYTIVLENTGNVSLTNISLIDTLPDSSIGSVTGPAGDIGTIGVLDIGETWAYTASYTVTQADINDGSDLVNTATVTCDQLGPVTDTEITPIRSFPWQLFRAALFIPPCPEEPLYCYMVSDRDNQNSTSSGLLKYTFSDNSLELIGRLGVGSVEAIALSLDAKTLYAVQSDIFGIIDTTPGNPASFVPVNPAGLGTAHGSNGWIPINDIDGMAFDPTTGILYATQRLFYESDLLIQIDPATGTFVRNAFGPNADYVVIGSNLTTIDWSDIDDIAIDLNGKLFGTANYQGVDDRFVEIDKQTGVVTELNPISFEGSPLNDVEGLSHYRDNVFFGTTGIETGSQQSANKNSFFQIKADPMRSEKITNLDQNFNGFIPYDFESVTCSICRP